MRIEWAATPEIETYIDELTARLLYEIIPQYFSSQEYKEIEKMYILNPDYTERNLYNGLLSEALQIVSSLQTLIAVIETIRYDEIQTHHRAVFKKNVDILQKYGFSFPLAIDQFSKEQCQVTMCYSDFSNYSFALN